jgi:hypothetical protein
MIKAVQAVDIKSIMVVKTDVGNPIMNYIHTLKSDNIYSKQRGTTTGDIQNSE